MKKTYIKPATKTVKMKMRNMLCISNVGMSSRSQSNGAALSRRSSFSDWDEDYE